MEGSKNTSALILNRQPYREYDSLVTVYTLDYGKLLLIARGTKKLQSKLAGHLEPLTLADIMIISGKGRDYVGAALGREIYSDIRGDLNKLYYAGQAVKIFNRLVRDNQADQSLFFLLTDWLEVLNVFLSLAKESGELLLASFSFQFLTELGYQPEIKKCLDCGSEIEPGKNYFHLLKGGVICASCQEKEKSEGDLTNSHLLAVSDNCLKIIRFILSNKFERIVKVKIDKKLAKELSTLADKFIQYHW
jgi:DNA repair protein RecO (recombination protein O)